MRVKEEADDYRYFREPDLVDLIPDQAWQHRVRDALGPMPAQRRATLSARLDRPTDALLDAVEVVIDLGLDGFVNGAIDAGVAPELAIARAANELAATIDTLDNLTLASFVATLMMEQRGDLSATQAKSVLLELLAERAATPRRSPPRRDTSASPRVRSATSSPRSIEANPDEWSRYREGDEKLAQFFVGQVMARTKGQANGKEVIAELKARR